MNIKLKITVSMCNYFQLVIYLLIVHPKLKENVMPFKPGR